MYTPVYNLVIHTQDGGCSGLCTHLYTTWSYTHRMVFVVGYVHTCIQRGHTHTQDGGYSGLCTHLYTTWSYTHRMVVVVGYVHTCINTTWSYTHTQDGGCSGLCTHLYTTWSVGLVLSTESYHFHVHIEQ